MAAFDYLLERIAEAEMREAPFRHLYIENFFHPGQFARITGAEQIRLPQAANDRELIALLHAHGYKEIPFPGTTTDLETYLAWHGSGQRQAGVNNPACEGFGVTFRLKAPAPGSVIARLHRFLKSEPFWQALAGRFGIDLATVHADAGIQKYLDGYEISPHPDVRAKALTFMVNINPARDSEQLEFHTHYMTFRPEHGHVRQRWITDLTQDRGWVPWEWCETRLQQRANNSLVAFAPSADTLHAVRAAYDHLRTQRTQCYGNLWFRSRDATPS